MQGGILHHQKLMRACLITPDSSSDHSPAFEAVHQLLRLEVPQLQAAISASNHHLVYVGVWVCHAAGLKVSPEVYHSLQATITYHNKDVR